MIALSAFDYEKKLKNPSKLFTNTWKSKSFINGLLDGSITLK